MRSNETHSRTTCILIKCFTVIRIIDPERIFRTNKTQKYQSAISLPFKVVVPAPEEVNNCGTTREQVAERLERRITPS